MKKIATYVDLAGDSLDIGYQLGSRIKNITELKALHTAGSKLDAGAIKHVKEVMDRWSPGLTDEIKGFAEALEAREEDMFFYFMTWLVPRCSQISLSGAVTEGGRPLVGRNYEFSTEAEDFSLVRTAVRGKHAHLGTSVLLMGRDEGMNDQGLVVTMSSCGFPVGSLAEMRNPALEGLQFWAAIRALLENCATAEDVVRYVKGMPISFNLNMIATDKDNNRVLVETYDGHQEVRIAGEAESLWVTNHAVLPELSKLEPQVMAHSKQRYENIEGWLKAKTAEALTGKRIVAKDLKQLLLSPYPQGLNCGYYDQYFGTNKSIVFDPHNGTMELCWGGQETNGWEIFSVHEPLNIRSREIELASKVPDMAMFQWVDR